MNFIFHDGGRAAAGFKGKTGDCVTRSVAIATGKSYQEVYDALNQLAQAERISKRKKRWSSSRTGVYRQTYQRYLESLGWANYFYLGRSARPIGLSINMPADGCVGGCASSIRRRGRLRRNFRKPVSMSGLV